jgi:hypothetical protein
VVEAVVVAVVEVGKIQQVVQEDQVAVVVFLLDKHQLVLQ